MPQATPILPLIQNSCASGLLFQALLDPNCLSGRDENAVLDDPLSADISLEPLYDLFRNEAVIKVFRRPSGFEIFFIDAGVIPKPLFDTQVAAMVCGFGDQVE